jgi:hypothetical protein
MKRFANILMLLSFALLQCTAPLAHAHINGGNQGAGVHMPETELSGEHGSRKVVETQNPGVQVGDRFEEYVSAHALAGGFMLQAAEQTAIRYYRSLAHPLNYPSTCSHRPYPQAPPARGPQ